MQLDNGVIDQITQNLLGVFERVGETREEINRKIRDAVRDAMERFDLVSREEFDVARQMLANTRIKVDALEKRVAELEKGLAGAEAHAEPAAPEPAAAPAPAADPAP